MAVRAAQNIYVKIGTAQFQREINNIQWTPPAPVTWSGGTPDANYAEVIGPGDLAITLVQDHATGSLWSLLYDAAGTEVQIWWAMQADGTYFTTKFVPLTPALGGAVNQYNEAQITVKAAKPTRTTKPAN